MIYESQYYGSVQLGDCLAHHGIKGQKWGVRRFQNPDGTLIHPKGNKKRKSLTDRQKSALKLAGGLALTGAAAYGLSKIGSGKAAGNLNALKTMSDDDLLAKVGRLEKEKQYINLTREISAYGESKAKGILSKAGGAAVATLATAGALYGGKVAIKTAADVVGKDGDKLIRDLFPKKK